jgi:general stress protein 26
VQNNSEGTRGLLVFNFGVWGTSKPCGFVFVKRYYGTIHIEPIFFNYVDGQILMATEDASQKIRNIKRNNNVSVLIDSTDVSFKGALVYGTAAIEYENGWPSSRKDCRASKRKRTRGG